MIDTINPMNFDITKNLHGHVRVELRDRWTGRVVDSQEKDNLITDAVQLMLQAATRGTGGQTMFAVAWLPLYSKLLGSIILFDGALTESASNISFPSSVKMVGYAGQGSDSTSAIRGSYNAQESVVTSNGFTTVWDFATSQANGTIGSLARTSHMMENNPCVGYSYGSYDSGLGASSVLSNSIILGYDSANNYVYFTVTSNRTEDGVTYSTDTIYKVKCDMSRISLLNPSINSQIETVKVLTSSDGTTTASNFIYDSFNNEFVYFSGTTIHIVAMNGTHTTKTATGTGTGSKCAITEDYYWKATGSVVYRVAKSNTADVQAFSIGGANIIPSENNIIYTYDNGFGTHNMIYPDGTTIAMGGATVSSSSQYAQSDYRAFGKLYSARTTTAKYAKTNYLGTIANLDSPVTKTSSQTMKITYTLTEA